MKPTMLSFPIVSFRNLETPFKQQGYKDYFAVVNVKDLPDLAGWRKINVRHPKLTGSVPTAIRKAFNEKKELFLFMNRGIVLSVDKVNFDADSKPATLSITLTDPNLHGLLDGGHTYNIVRDELKPELDQFVKVEILEGFRNDDITDVVDARNTSNQVRDESLMNLARHFDELKNALEDAPYFSDIAWSEYETDKNGDPKPIDIREVIAILTAFDKDHFDESVHPINSYRSKSACLNHFRDHRSSYRKIYPLAKEILELYDYVQDKLPNLYNSTRGQSGEVSSGRFGKLTGVTYRKGKPFYNLYFLNKKIEYGTPDGFVYPILGAFRAILEEKAGRFVWGKGLNPVDLLDGPVGQKLADTIGSFALEAKNPSKTGKSQLVWQSCYQTLQVAYLQSKEK